MDILDGLNNEQRQAVEHTDGPLLVVAGAGTGKTQVITRRIAYLIEQGLAKPSQVLALTFTEKAAREMADRLHSLLGWQSFEVPIMTFNSFGAELLGQFASHIGRSVRGGLLNTTQKTLLIQQHFDRIDLQYYGPPVDLYEFIERIVMYIERLQNAGVTADAYREFATGLKPGEAGWTEGDIAEQQDLAAIYSLYEELKAETGTYDYNDQLVLPLRILQQRPNLTARLNREYRYVLVDEYQDTSPVQDALLREMIQPGGNIFAVGDDDQAIYSFRGADISNILAFADHFRVPASLALVQNYRSGQPVLDAAYRLIRHNDPDRLEVRLGLNKQLQAQTDEAEVSFTPYRTAADEQAGVVETIKQRLATGQPAASMAVLARSNAVLRSYAKAMRAQVIPFALSAEANIFEQRELIHLWYVLEWLGQRASDESIAHLVLGPFVGWSAAGWRPVMERSRAELVGAEEALANLAAEGNVQAAALMSQLETWRQWAMTLPVSQLAYRLVFETGLSERLREKGEENSRVIRVFEDLHLLLGQMQDYETVALDTGLAGYLVTFPKPPTLETSEALGDADGVQLLTVHAAKGLEFESVFVVNCTAKSWSERPASGLQVPEALKQGAELRPEHEQRRLMYVAVTRAKRALQLSAPIETAGGQRQAVSPLVTEVLGEEPSLTLEQPAGNTMDKALHKIQRLYPLQGDLPDERLPFETADGWIDLGVGALGLYKRCPHEFYLQYVLGIAEPFGAQLAFGTALHAVAQAFYDGQMLGETPTVAELQGRLDELWSDRGYESRQLADRARALARETVERFVRRERTLAGERSVLGSELKITLEIPEAKLRLRGRIDAYFETPDGVEIRDFKTGSKRDAEKLSAEAKDSFQLRTYALAYEMMKGQAPARVTLDYIVTGVEGSAVLTPRILANHRAKLGELADGIRRREFAPAPPSEFHQCAAFTYYGVEDEEAERV